MKKELTPIFDDERELSYEASKILTMTPQVPSVNYSPFNESNYESRTSEGPRLNSRALIGLSRKKRQSTSNFLAKPFDQQPAPSGTIYRVSYGENMIPPVSEARYHSAIVTEKPFIPPEYKKYEDKPHKLPLFLREKLYKTVRTKKFLNTATDEAQLNQELEEKSVSPPTRTDFLPSLQKERRFNPQHTVSAKDLGRNGYYDSTRNSETPDYPYFSPKARQQMRSDAVPLLISNVILAGAINPEGLAPQDEAAIEHIITEYHAKVRQTPVLGKGRSKSTDGKQSKVVLSKFAVAMNLFQQNKKKKEGETLHKKIFKYAGSKAGLRLRAAVGHLEIEKEEKKKRVLDLLKTKKFNLFRPTTINNFHLLQNALSEE